MLKRKTITLTLTRSCNLNCSYCFENHKSNKKMNMSMIESILDKELVDPAFDEFEIDLFGGEPFLEFGLIKQTVEYVLKKFIGTKLIFCITTNGTLVHGEIQDWLVKYKDWVICALSLDGTKRMQDINRCNCYDAIDIDFFAKTWPKQPMKMTVSAETLPYLSEGIIFMHENNYAFTVNLAFDIDWSEQTNASTLERELKILIDYYLARPDITPCTLLNVPIYFMASAAEDEKFRQCGAGVEMFTYDADGKAYPCQFFMPLTLGDEKAEKARSLVFPDEISRDSFVGDCRTCKALEICHTCYGSNYASTGNIYEKDMNWCKLQKITFKANAYFRFKQIQNGTFKCEEDERPYWINGIHMLLTDFD